MSTRNSKGRKRKLKKKPWWKSKKYSIGTLTSKERQIKLINMLTDHEDIVTVPCEETI